MRSRARILVGRLTRVSDAKWWLAPVPRVYVAVLFLLLCLVAGGVWAKQSSDEHSFCVVQARGLPASHHLAAGFQDIGQLLALANPQRLAQLPARQRDLYDSLRDNSNAYARIESKQPQSRQC